MAFIKKPSGAVPVQQVDDQLRHVAFIMDGNGRWAQKRGLPREMGHKAGASTFRKISTHCFDIGCQTVTVYAFSTENWKRPAQEVSAIMNLLDRYLDEVIKDGQAYTQRIRFIGDLLPLTPAIREKIAYAESLNAGAQQLLNIALNYGGRDELVHAFNRLVAEGRQTVTERDISDALYTAGSPDPDLIIRTGGEVRTSNFLLWQAAYAEWYFTDTLWPDLTPEEVDAGVRAFYARRRRYGGL